MAKRKLEPDELRRMVDAERVSILSELSELAKEDAAAREKEAKRQARYNRQASRLLMRGKGLIPVVQMADALSWNRQHAHRAIREAETVSKNGKVS
jgi:ABC-type oligopeptide transport system substrate-binding subunit